ncbi:zinc-binding protein A33-like [Mustelus asterias]
MAVSKHILSLSEDLTCSICRSLFVEPVRLDCDHNFCKSCIQKCWGKQRQAVSCPECQQLLPRRGFTSNRVLANLCEKTRQLELKLEEEHGEKLDGDTEREQSLCEKHGEKLDGDTEREQSLCEKHGEKLILFCEDDEILICAKCVDSPPHSDHRFIPMQKVVQKYKDQLKLSLDSMENKKKNQSEFKQRQERKILELEQLTGSLEQDISAQFAQIHRYLEDKEKHLIEELKRQKEEDLRPMEKNLRRIKEELTSLEGKILNLCVDIEQQDSVSFLKELKRLRESYLDKGEDEAYSDGSIISKRSDDEEDEYGFEDSDSDKTPDSLTLDPNTVHRDFILSDGQTCVKFKNSRLRGNSERFDECRCVLGSEGFKSGKHYWEVEVSGSDMYAIGVARESAKRKGKLTLNPNKGYWSVGRRNHKCGANEQYFVPLTANVTLRTIGVFLDYDGGQVIFYNADDMSVLYNFTDRFSEELFPFLYPQSPGMGDGALKLRHFEP